MYGTRRDTSTPHNEAPIGLTDLGRVRVLGALADAGPLTRSDIVARTGLARATVSSVLYDLIGGGLVRESAAPEGGGPAAGGGTRAGRPPQLLALAPEAGYAVGLDIGHDRVRVVLTDLVGTVRWDRTTLLPVDDHPDETLATAEQLVDAAVADTGVPRDRILGLGAGFACPVDQDGQRLHADNIMRGWTETRPVDELAARTGLRVQMINDANAGVLAERRYGAARGSDDVLYLRLSSGLGIGAICGGRMLLGHKGIAGEIGHVSVDRNGALCRCGNRGCLETVASPPAIARLLSHSWGRTVTSEELPGLLAAGDRGARRAVEDAGEVVGRALAAAVMLLNPQLIVVGGELAAAGEVLFEPLHRALVHDTTGSHIEHLKIMESALGDSAGVRGAAATVLEHVPELLAQAPAAPEAAATPRP